MVVILRSCVNWGSGAADGCSAGVRGCQPLAKRTSVRLADRGRHGLRRDIGSVVACSTRCSTSTETGGAMPRSSTSELSRARSPWAPPAAIGLADGWLWGDGGPGMQGGSVTAPCRTDEVSSLVLGAALGVALSVVGACGPAIEHDGHSGSNSPPPPPATFGFPLAYPYVACRSRLVNAQRPWSPSHGRAHEMGFLGPSRPAF